MSRLIQHKQNGGQWAGADWLLTIQQGVALGLIQRSCLHISFFKVPKASCCLLGWAGTIVWPTGQWILNENLWYNLLTYWSGSAKGKLIIIVHQSCKKEIDSSSSRCSNYDIAPRNLTQSFILCFYERALTGRASQWMIFDILPTKFSEYLQLQIWP